MVYTLGESLLDIIISSMNNVVVRPGGAMLNTAVSLGRYGVDVRLITEVGDDETSKMIISFLQTNNVATGFVQSYTNNNTSLALAFLDENKKPKYTFIKNYPENRSLANIPEFKGGDILLFGSLYSLDEKIRKNILSIVNCARENNATIIYDPNIRNAHHLNNDELINAVFENIKLSDIIKGSDEDFTNIFGSRNTLSQIAELRKLNKEALIIITLGADGVTADYNGHLIKLPAVETNVISTIGAGDAFNAGMIYELDSEKFQNRNLKNNQPDFVKNILKTGLEFSAKVCSSLDNYVGIKTG